MEGAARKLDSFILCNQAVGGALLASKGTAGDKQAAVIGGYTRTNPAAFDGQAAAAQGQRLTIADDFPAAHTVPKGVRVRSIDIQGKCAAVNGMPCQIQGGTFIPALQCGIGRQTSIGQQRNGGVELLPGSIQGLLQTAVFHVANLRHGIFHQQGGSIHSHGKGQGRCDLCQCIAPGQLSSEQIRPLVGPGLGVAVTVPGGQRDGLPVVLHLGQNGHREQGQKRLQRDKILRVPGDENQAGIRLNSILGIHPGPGGNQLLWLSGFLGGLFGRFLGRPRCFDRLGSILRRVLLRGSLPGSILMFLGADKGAGATWVHLAIAAGGVMDVGAGKHPGHATAGLGAGMGAGIRRCPLLHQGYIRIAGCIVDMDTSSAQGLTFLGMHMGAGRAGLSLGIAALGSMHRVMGIHPLCKSRQRDITQHHTQAQQQRQPFLENFLVILLHTNSLLLVKTAGKAGFQVLEAIFLIIIVQYPHLLCKRNGTKRSFLSQIAHFTFRRVSAAISGFRLHQSSRPESRHVKSADPGNYRQQKSRNAH